MKYGYYWVALALCLGAFPAFAANSGDDGVTMTIVQDNDKSTERDFVQDIELPEAARGERARSQGRDRGGDDARENAERGKDQASEARQQKGRGNAENRPDGNVGDDQGDNAGDGQGDLIPDVGQP